MERASIGVTINSQAGLEMLLLGKPMVTAGRCFYSKNGFTYDLFQKSDLESKIIEAMQAGLTDSAKEELYEFSSYLFDHYLLPKDLLLSVQKVNRLREILV
jgi:capsule polysaccharide export protein KpsC/LpsZ